MKKNQANRRRAAFREAKEEPVYQQRETNWKRSGKRVDQEIATPESRIVRTTVP